MRARRQTSESESTYSNSQQWIVKEIYKDRPCMLGIWSMKYHCVVFYGSPQFLFIFRFCLFLLRMVNIFFLLRYPYSVFEPSLTIAI